MDVSLAAVDPGQPPWVAIALAAIALFGVMATAFGPVLVERARSRAAARTEPAAAPAAGPPPPAPSSALAQDFTELIEDAVADTRRQRDQATDRADRLQQHLDRANRELADLRVELARHEARGRRG